MEGSPKKLVLLVDDEEEFLEIAAIRLEAAGFEIVKARGAHEGITKVHELMPDVVVSDVFMPPGPDGWSFALALRENNRTKHIPFAFLSSLRDPWLERASDKEAVKARVGDITILSKFEDMAVLGEKILKLVS
jgi:CheY-like chemotaxis protein